MRLFTPALFVAVLSVSMPALAQDCAPSDESQMCLNQRAGAEYKSADDQLNKTYGEIVRRLADDAESRTMLQAAQRAWIAFRDAECAFANDHSKDGSIYPLLMGQCLTALTQTRTGQLDAYLNCEEGDLSCPVPSGQ
jgi:uncharacterized protein YecT (DUF1311 family)